MPQRLAGQLVDGGDPVADEPVFVVDTGPDDESNWSIVATDRSAGDGSWSVTVPNADAERYHAVAQFEDGGTLKNALSKPFLTSQPFAQPGLVTVGFDVLTPSTIGSAIPDSDILQLDAQDSDSIIENGSVTTWEDLSGEGNNLDEGSATSYESDAINGYPAVRLDGVDDNLYRDGWVHTTGSIDQPVTVISVVQVLEDPSDSHNPWLGSTRSDFEIVNGARDNGHWEMFAGSHVAGVDGQSQWDNDPHIHSFLFNTNDSEARLDGGIDATGDAGTESWQGPNLGRANSASSRYFDGYVGEIRIYDELLGDDEVESVEGYLSDKWDIPLVD